jgi:hypothetical protein
MNEKLKTRNLRSHECNTGVRHSHQGLAAEYRCSNRTQCAPSSRPRRITWGRIDEEMHVAEEQPVLKW